MDGASARERDQSTRAYGGQSFYGGDSRPVDAGDGEYPIHHEQESKPWFSRQFREAAVFSIAKACLEAVVNHRNTVLYENSDSGIAMKGVIYLTTELALILLIPVAIIEGVARFAIACLACPLAAMHLISDDQLQNDDGSYDFYVKFVNGHVDAAKVLLTVSLAVFSHLNPEKEINVDNHELKLHFPVVYRFLDDY